MTDSLDRGTLAVCTKCGAENRERAEKCSSCGVTFKNDVRNRIFVGR